MAYTKPIRKEDLKEDRFLKVVFNLRKTVESYRKQWSYAGIALIVLTLAVYGIFQYREKKNEEAAVVFGKGTLMLNNGNYTEALAEFKKVVEQYGGSKAASKALFLTGSVYYSLGNYQLAIDAFKQYVSKYSNHSFLGPAVYKGLGASYMQLNDYRQATEAFKKAISTYNDDFQIPEIRYKLALSALELKDTVSAKTELREIVKSSPKSTYAKQAELLLLSM